MFCLFCFRGFCLFLFVLFVCFSLGVALSRGHGKFFFRGNVTVEEGRKSAFLLSDSFLVVFVVAVIFVFLLFSPSHSLDPSSSSKGLCFSVSH